MLLLVKVIQTAHGRVNISGVSLVSIITVECEFPPTGRVTIYLAEMPPKPTPEKPPEKPPQSKLRPNVTPDPGYKPPANQQ